MSLMIVTKFWFFFEVFFCFSEGLRGGGGGGEMVLLWARATSDMNSRPDRNTTPSPV